MKNRKVILFLITMAAVVIMSIFNKDTTTLVALFATYCCGNVGSKITTNLNRHEIG